MGSEKITFEEAFSRLEQLVQELEQGGTNLERSVKAFQEGMDLIGICNEQLQKAEQKVQQLIKKSDGTLSAEEAEE